MTRKDLLLASAAALLLPSAPGRAAERELMNALTLWYDRPATHAMTEALPIGNGRLGGVVFGGTASERFAFNEDSLWTGDTNPSGNYDTMGAYQAFGDILIDLPGHEKVTEYRRDLDLETAIAHVQYAVKGIGYVREYLASAPDQVVAIRLTADKPGSYTGAVRLKDAHNAATKADGNTLAFAGALDNGLWYAARLRAIAEGGAVHAMPDDSLTFTGCDALTLLLTAGTDYAMNPDARFRGPDPHMRLIDALDAAARKGCDALRAAHITDHQELFKRVTFDLGQTASERSALPTDRRKVLAAQGGDPELEALLFQYGRYLLIACSRPGGLPANLQGLWNDSNAPPWHCDYHANINIQMNYWPAEPANLSPCHRPLFALIESQLPDWRAATAASPEFGRAEGAAVRGWAIRTSHNTMGGMGWDWDKTANAWYCRHFYEHYAYTGDRTFLREVAYPVLKETAQFWEDHLKTLPDSFLVVPSAWSPEHGPHEDGVSYSQEIVWDLFTNTIEASAALDVDAPYRAKLTSLRDRLATPGIGSWGQLLEWMTEKHDPQYPELDTPGDHHRHTSHLFAVYPGRQIRPRTTPALAAAAKVSLAARGDTGDVREWSFAWRTALWARLGDGDRAYGQLAQLFSDRNTCPNLFGLHPPMQMDGNFGITAGITEMLLQSAPGEIDLLPALPSAWPAGHVCGLRARGGWVVDMRWVAGKLASASLHAALGGEVHVRCEDRAVDLRLGPNEVQRLDGMLKGAAASG